MRQKSFARCRGLVGQVIFVLFLIVVLILLVLPELRQDGPRHTDYKQMDQLHSMSTALELFAHEFEGYPPSDANDPTGVPYGGAMKLAEAVMGRDLLGSHAESVFRADGLNGDSGEALYPGEPNETNLKARKGPYIQPENANPYRLVDIYGKGKTGPFDENLFVLCDPYGRKTASGLKTGMPILYYRANPDGTTHDLDNPDNPGNIYDYRDNQMLLSLGVPGEPNAAHPLSDPKRFYMMSQFDAAGPPRPKKADTFILISAGYDGLYGTPDDIRNFDWKHQK
jgi:hypothetical protein